MEAYASGTGIARMAQARNIAQTSEEVFALAAQGHGDALSLLNTAITAAGRGICALINILSPDAVLFSGGLCAQDALYVRPLIEYIRTHAYALAVSDALLLCTASLGADAPVIGAALLDASL